MIVERRERTDQLFNPGRYDVFFRKIKAHVGNHYNEKCDKLAKVAIGLLEIEQLPEESQFDWVDNIK